MIGQLTFDDLSLNYTQREIGRCRVRLICYRSPADCDGLQYGQYHAASGTPDQRAAYADTQTGKHDCRAALCIALGVPLDQIGPLGHNLAGVT